MPIPASSPYGPDDQIGRLNELSPQKVIEAVRLVRTGEIHDLGRTLDEDSPAFPGRSFDQSLRTTAHQVNRREPDAGPEGKGEHSLNWIVDIVSATSQMGTHLDGLNHLQTGERFYNGYMLGDIAERWGTNKLGIETVPQILTRGVLINVAAHRGVERLAGGEVITPDDVEACLADAGLAVTTGDVVLFHTGWGGLWGEDDAAYVAEQPGPGLALARWLVEAGAVLSGCDTWSFGPVPPENPDRPFEVPQTLNIEHGYFIVENLDTSGLAASTDALAVEFLFVLTHAKVRGATGAWISPIAVT